jgi:hypothetical protein
MTARTSPRRALGASSAGIRSGIPRLGDLAVIRWARVASGTRNARAIWALVSPHTTPRGATRTWPSSPASARQVGTAGAAWPTLKRWTRGRTMSLDDAVAYARS